MENVSLQIKIKQNKLETHIDHAPSTVRLRPRYTCSCRTYAYSYVAILAHCCMQLRLYNKHGYIENVSLLKSSKRIWLDQLCLYLSLVSLLAYISYKTRVWSLCISIKNHDIHTETSKFIYNTLTLHPFLKKGFIMASAIMQPTNSQLYSQLYT